MHSFTPTDSPIRRVVDQSKTPVARFHYNSDLSGDVEIVVGDKRLAVYGADLLEFVAEYARARRISQLEQASAAELLGYSR